MTERSALNLTLAEPASLWETFGLTLVRSWKAVVVGCTVGGLVVAAGISLLTPRQFRSGATFIPQSSEAQVAGGLALAARQFGIQLPGSNQTWGLPVYSELLMSRELLAPLALDTLEVAERDGKRIAVMELLRIPDGPMPVRTERTVRKLRTLVGVVEDKRLNAIRLTVTTRWPSVSFTLARRLLDAVNRFNLETRKSQASAERQFVEAQAAEAKQGLFEAEGRLESFLKQNRSITGSPELMFARDRLQREVTLRQEVYTTLVQSREEARIREVRDTPVITVLEGPRLAATGEPRGTAVKGVLGAFAGCLLAIGFAFVREGLREARATPSGPLGPLVRVFDEATRSILRQAR